MITSKVIKSVREWGMLYSVEKMKACKKMTNKQ